jgi:hypothetical protein
MRKRIISQDAQAAPASQPWLDVTQLASVEMTSEDPTHPMEAALVPGRGSGWRADRPGEQIIRLRFDEALHLGRIRLVFQETQRARTQEFALRWSPDEGRSYRQVVRQQYNFSPPDTTREVEEYPVNLDRVTNLELSIVPDISGGDALASLAELRLA